VDPAETGSEWEKEKEEERDGMEEARHLGDDDQSLQDGGEGCRGELGGIWKGLERYPGRKRGLKVLDVFCNLSIEPGSSARVDREGVLRPSPVPKARRAARLPEVHSARDRKTKSFPICVQSCEAPQAHSAHGKTPCPFPFTCRAMRLLLGRVFKMNKSGKQELNLSRS